MENEYYHGNLINKKSKMFASSSSATPPSPPWTELPDDLTMNILQRLRIEDMMRAQLVCSTWWRICKNPSLWREIDLDCQQWGNEEFDDICRFAVDRSQGQLVDLSVTSFAGDYGFLNYASERSSQLRSLTLTGYGKIGSALNDALEKLPQLEELNLIQMPMLSIEQFESIGISCPMLKSFEYNEYPEDVDDGRFSIEYGVAIGKTMPNLRHLGLEGLRTKNEGLEAILDGCPHLETLHLKRCYGLDLQGGLGKRCSDQIKDLIIRSKSSYESAGDHADYDWDDDKDSSNDDLLQGYFYDTTWL